MRRREFLSIAGAHGLSAPALAAAPLSEARAGPKDRPIQVAIGLSDWNSRAHP